MFDVKKDNIREAYWMLNTMSTLPALPEKKADVAIHVANLKRAIRAYNNRPAPDARIISADYNGRMELVQLPNELDKAHKVAAADWFREHRYLEYYNSPYDCTGQEFTNWFHLFRRRGHWFAYHSISRDV